MEDKQNMVEHKSERKPLSDDAVDGICALLIIFLLVIAVVYWLQNMP